MGQSSMSGSAAACDAAQTSGQSRAFRPCWRTYRVHGLLVVCAGAVFFWATQFAAAVQKREKELRADTVTAGRIELIGANGKKAALLYPGAHGGARMSFYDEKEIVRLGVGISDDGEPELLLNDRNGNLKLSVALRTASAQPTITLYRDKILEGISLSLTAGEDGASVSLAGKKGSGSVRMSLDSDGMSAMTLKGAGDKRGIILLADGDSQWISLTAGGRKPVSLGLQVDGSSPELLLGDDTDKVRTTITLKPNGETTYHRMAH